VEEEKEKEQAAFMGNHHEKLILVLNYVGGEGRYACWRALTILYWCFFSVILMPSTEGMCNSMVAQHLD
jgi:hypothetical protein